MYYSVIADEVTDRHANKDIILVCLRFMQTIGKKVIAQKSLLDSNRMSGRATGKNVAEHIINILKKHEININSCRGQAYDRASAMSSDIKGAQSYIKKIEPKAANTHCRNHLLSLAIANVCQNASIKRFMISLTEANSFLDTSPKRQQCFELFMNFYKKELSVSESEIKHAKGLSKTRWVERHEACDIFYLLHR